MRTLEQLIQTYESPAKIDGQGGFTPEKALDQTLDCYDNIMGSGKKAEQRNKITYEKDGDYDDYYDDGHLAKINTKPSKEEKSSEQSIIEEEVKNFNPEDYYEYE